MTTEKQVPFFVQSGASIARSTAQQARLLDELGQHLKPIATDYAAWMAARAQFIEGANSAGYAAPEDLWERTLAAGRSFGLIPDTPKSQAPEAVKKAKQRTEAAEKFAAEIEGKTPVELKAEAAKAAEAGDFKRAAKLASAAESQVKAAERDAKAKALDATKADREAIKAAVELMVKAADGTGLGMLAKCARALAEGQHASVAKALKAIKLKGTEPAPV